MCGRKIAQNSIPRYAEHKLSEMRELGAKVMNAAHSRVPLLLCMRENERFLLLQPPCIMGYV